MAISLGIYPIFRQTHLVVDAFDAPISPQRPVSGYSLKFKATDVWPEQIPGAFCAAQRQRPFSDAFGGKHSGQIIIIH